MRSPFADNDVYYDITGCRCTSAFKYLDVHKVHAEKKGRQRLYFRIDVK